MGRQFNGLNTLALCVCVCMQCARDLVHDAKCGYIACQCRSASVSRLRRNAFTNTYSYGKIVISVLLCKNNPSCPVMFRLVSSRFVSSQTTNINLVSFFPIYRVCGYVFLAAPADDDNFEEKKRKKKHTFVSRTKIHFERVVRLRSWVTISQNIFPLRAGKMMTEKLVSQ